MNKKGFTLIELLAVIVILSVVMLIGSASISAVKRAIDKNMFETKLDFIISAGKNYGQDNKELFMDASGLPTKTVTKTVGELIQNGSLKTDESELKSKVSYCAKEIPSTDGSENRCAVVTNPVEGNIINDLTVIIYMENNRVYSCIPLNNNRSILNDISCTKSNCSGDTCTWTNCEYSDLNYYCVKY